MSIMQIGEHVVSGGITWVLVELKDVPDAYWQKHHQVFRKYKKLPNYPWTVYDHDFPTNPGGAGQRSDLADPTYIWAVLIPASYLPATFNEMGEISP
jgi:hypothetical protein